MAFPRSFGRLSLSVSAALALISCAAVGPDFAVPPTPAPAAYLPDGHPSDLVVNAADPFGAPQRLQGGETLSEAWWTVFRSAELDALVQQALARNGTIEAGSAALAQARELLAAQSGSRYPSVSAQAGVSRNRASGAQIGFSSPPSSYDLFNAGVSVSYTLDLFGAVRRQIETYAAQVDVQAAQVQALRLMISGNVVAAVIRDQQYRDQIAAWGRIAADQDQGLALTRRRFEAGAVTLTDVINQQTALAITRTNLAPLERLREQNRHALAALIGVTPDASDLAVLERITLSLPQQIPLSVPSALAHRRPDIRVAEAQMHVACAQLGVATAGLYPQVTLSGNLGVASLQPSSLFQSGSVAWGLGASVLQPVFRGGALQAQKRAAADALDASAASYRQTVTNAFANVADALSALTHDAQALEAQVQAADQAHAGLELAQRQFEAGAASAISLLAAQQADSQTRIGLAQARADRLADTAALLTALGGGEKDALALVTSQEPASH